MSELIDWFGNPITIAEMPKPETDINPCIPLYGPGPEGQACKGCVHLRYPYHPTLRKWKCDLRRLSHGNATNHKVRWPACGKYERRQGEYNGG